MLEGYDRSVLTKTWTLCVEGIGKGGEAITGFFVGDRNRVIDRHPQQQTLVGRMNLPRPDIEFWFLSAFCPPQTSYPRGERGCRGVEERGEVIVFLLGMGVLVVVSLP